MDADNDAADSENTELGKEEEYDDDDGDGGDDYGGDDWWLMMMMMMMIMMMMTDDGDDAPSFLPSPSLAANCAEFVPVSLAWTEPWWKNWANSDNLEKIQIL